MQRYHKSFIGIMETAKDGEWIQYKDYEFEENKFIDNYNELLNLRFQNSSLNSENKRLNKQLEKVSTIAAGAISFILAVIATFGGYYLTH